MTKQTAHAHTASILIVEDAEMCSSTLEVALSSINGHVVRIASSAEAALRMIAERPASAVVTDLHLPGISGFELISRIRATQFPQRPVIVVTSGDTDPETPHNVLKIGADAFFPKPYSPVELRRTLERLIHVK